LTTTHHKKLLLTTTTTTPTVPTPTIPTPTIPTTTTTTTTTTTLTTGKRGINLRMDVQYSDTGFKTIAGMDKFVLTVGGVNILTIASASGSPTRCDATNTNTAKCKGLGHLAHIEVDSAPPGSCLVKITGMASIPFLGVSTSLTANVNKAGAAIAWSTSVFGLQASVAVKWGWNFLTAADLSFTAMVSTASVSETLTRVKQNIQDEIDQAQNFLCDLMQKGEDIGRQVSDRCSLGCVLPPQQKHTHQLTFVFFMLNLLSFFFFLRAGC
jgi:hypothetical protein